MEKIQRILQQPKIHIVLLSSTTILLLVGLCLPVMTIRTLIFLRHSFSVISGIYDLLKNGNYFLFVIVGLFSVVLPLAKLVFLFAIVIGEINPNANNRRYLEWLHNYGRWAMLDVFVVALLVVAIKLGDIANVKIHFGFYVFATAVLLTMWITHLINKQVIAKRNSVSKTPYG